MRIKGRENKIRKKEIEKRGRKEMRSFDEVILMFDKIFRQN